MGEMDIAFGGLFRFGAPISKLVHWPDIGKRAGMRAELRKGLMRDGRLLGSDPKEWYGTLTTVSLGEVHPIQVLVNGKQWVNIETVLGILRETIRIPIMEREHLIEVATRAYLDRHPGAQVAPVERACVNYLRHEGTYYDRFTEQIRSRSTNDSLLFLFRRRVYHAITEAYDWLAEECDQQLRHRGC
jgi:hypothetical protein